MNPAPPPISVPATALSALGPALRRTRALLSPFRLGTFLKLVLIATFAEAGMVIAIVIVPVDALQIAFQISQRAQGQHLPLQARAGIGALIIGIAGLLTLIWMAFAYLFTRLRFVVFEMVAGGGTRVGDAWRATSRGGGRFFGLNLLVALALLIPTLAAATPLMLALFHGGAMQQPATAFGAVVVLYFAFFALSVMVRTVDSVLRDFWLPPIVLEDASIESASVRFFSLLRERTGSVLLFVAMRVALTIGLAFAAGMALFIVFLIVGGLLALAGVLLYAVAWDAGFTARAIFFLYCFVAGIFTFAAIVLGSITTQGLCDIFRTAYAAEFFASYYPALGSRMFPPPPGGPSPPPAASPAAPSAGEPPQQQSWHIAPPSLGEPPPVW